MPTYLRVPGDPGYLSNKRMALEIAIGVAHLAGRELALPVDEPIGWGPRPARPEGESGAASSLRDLYEIPVRIADAAEVAEATSGMAAHRPAWPELNAAVVADPPSPATAGEDLAAFAAGREVLRIDPAWATEPVVELPRTLAHYSCFFFLGSDRREQLFQLLRQVRPREPYRRLAQDLAAGLGRFNAAHLRRTDLLVGVRDYRTVTPRQLRDTLAEAFESTVPLVVCTEADPASDVFGPLRAHFRELVFLNDHVIGEARDRLDALPRFDDSALALVNQEVATRAEGFAGTMGSTFTGIIHRQRVLADPAEPFRFTADFLGAGDRFSGGRYEEIGPGRYSWNRLGLPIDPGAMAWFREWVEVVP